MVRLSILVPLLAAVFCLFVVAQGVEEEAKVQQTKEQRRLQAEARVEKINKSQRKWKAKVHPRFVEMSDGEFKKMLGLKRDPAEHAKRLAARNLEEEGRPTRAKWSAGLVPKKQSLLDRVNLGKKKTTTATSTTSTAAPPEFPPFDAREEWPECADVIGKVQDQSYCGSCWAVASASVMQDRICIRSGGKQKPEISAADVMSCAPGFGCDGGWPEFAFLYWAAHGVCTGSNYTNWQGCKPYPVPPDAKSMFNTSACSRHCTNRHYNKRYLTDLHYGHGVGMLAENDETDIMQVILFGGPVEADMVVYSDFVFYSSGVYAHGPDAYVLGGHAVRIIGWGYDEDADLPYWLVVNSWSTDWGENGYFKIERGLDESFIESWGINFGEPVVD